ncbi:MAG TPA: BON domain-containing protein [Acidimicrobiales bacterium]|nr:BON domain-containing protein [Acidimicrobiales bacterium]
MSNAQVTRDVLDELLWDDAIDASRITVTANDGRVVLGGTVNYFHEKWNAGEDAQRVVGVRDVVNEIAVDTAARQVQDQDLARSAQAGLDANGLVPKGKIKIDVSDGFVSMTGNVHHYYERQAAEHVIRHLSGLAGFTDDVTVSQDPAEAVSEGISDSLVRNAAVDANSIKVADSGGNVTLSGTVRSYPEKQEAERSAWMAPGVVSVDNQLVITP